ncbi:MAG: PhzF family phenazine biosynthesis protein [Pseudomonadota bacterium]
MTPYAVYDVFTDQPFAGNPLAVVFDAAELDTEAMVAITREFNFSETTFILPPEDSAHTAKVRIFTPSAELPFAGHPTVGTALALNARGAGAEQVLELGVGPIPVTIAEGRAEFVTRTPLTRGEEPEIARIAACLGLTEAAIRTKAHAPQMASVGLSFCLVELTDRASLTAVVTDLPAFREAADRYSDRANFGLFCYTRDGGTVHARMFAPTGGIPEDPATGSASAALTAYLATLDASDLTLTIHQGEDMGRPSRIETRATFSDGAVRSVAVAGRARKVMEGQLTA